MDVVTVMRERLQGLAPEQIEITDESAAHAGHAGAARGGGHYHLTIVAACFAGENRVARHRRIYTALGDLVPARIHALGIVALTPDER